LECSNIGDARFPIWQWNPEIGPNLEILDSILVMQHEFFAFIWDSDIEERIAWGQAISGREDCNAPFSKH